MINFKETDESVPESSGKRKAGKQAGAKGVGRRVEMAVTGEEVHAAQACAGCGGCLAEEVPFRATTGMYVLDLEREEQGIQVTHVKHIYGERSCPCGHVTATPVTLYLIGRRSWDVMEGFAGWLMSDGYGQYRHYAKRLRCLAHIMRKARGLAESCHPEATQFGQSVLAVLATVIPGIYQVRDGPESDLPAQFSQELDQLRELCQQHRDHSHEKTRKLARELLNDWEAIWTVLHHPQLPITNNLAEQALRHWVIARKISHGTRTRQGSRTFTLLASVIDTCRQRGISPWPYIADVIAQRRQGNPAPPLPLSA